MTTLVTGADATVAAPRSARTGSSRPSWIGNDRLLLSRDVSVDGEGTTFALYALGAAVGAVVQRPGPRLGDAASTPPPPATAAAWRSSTTTRRRAEGTPTRVVLRLYTGTTVRCELGLEAADTFMLRQPSFSPDGSQVAWAESDGIHVAADCGGERVVTLPGAWEPYWSAYTRAEDGRRRPIEPGPAGEGRDRARRACGELGWACGSRCRAAHDRSRRRAASALSRACSITPGTYTVRVQCEGREAVHACGSRAAGRGTAAWSSARKVDVQALSLSV